MRTIAPSEFIINSDGSAFHLHIRPEQLADNVLLVGDPGRVILLKELLTDVEFTSQSREFVSTTGKYNGRRVTLLSTGIGCDNIDIVLNELDALANIDFATRTIKPEHRTLRILRYGTSGAVQPDIQPGVLVYSTYSIGLDGLLNWYGNVESVCDMDMEAAFIKYMNWNPRLANPYFVRNSELIEDDFADSIHGITLSAPGFYGPQGRVLRLPLVDKDYLAKLESFRYNGMRITNFEMEGSAIAGMCHLLGHQGATVCLVIAQRVNHNMNVDYKPMIMEQAQVALSRLAKEAPTPVK